MINQKRIISYLQETKPKFGNDLPSPPFLNDTVTEFNLKL